MSRLRWPDSTNSVSEKPGTIHSHAVSAPDEVRDEVPFPDPDAAAADRRGLAARR